MAEITTLLFDIGNVLIDIDVSKGAEILFGHIKNDLGADLSTQEIQRRFFEDPHDDVWDDFETNKINKSEFLQQFSKHVGFNGDLALLEQAMKEWFTPLAERIRLLNDIIKENKFKVALVSDTNEIHITYIEKTIPAIFRNLMPEHRFYSYKAGHMKKHGKEFYQHVLGNIRVKPENALMIDDRPRNKTGADEIGLNFLLIQKDEDLATALRSAPYHLTV